MLFCIAKINKQTNCLLFCLLLFTEKFKNLDFFSFVTFSLDLALISTFVFSSTFFVVSQEAQ